MAPYCKLELAIFSALLRIQDVAECGNYLIVYASPLSEGWHGSFHNNTLKTFSSSPSFLETLDKQDSDLLLLIKLKWLKVKLYVFLASKLCIDKTCLDNNEITNI